MRARKTNVQIERKRDKLFPLIPLLGTYVMSGSVGFVKSVPGRPNTETKQQPDLSSLAWSTNDGQAVLCLPLLRLLKDISAVWGSYRARGWTHTLSLTTNY